MLTRLLLNDSALTALDLAVRAALRHDPATCQRLKPLVGSTVRVGLSAPAVTLYLSVVEDGVEFSVRPPVASHDDTFEHQGCDAEITGSVSDFLAALSKPGLGSGVQVRGNSQLVLTLTECLQQLDIDWEGWLGDHIGDLAAHQLASGLRHTRHYFRSTGSLLLDDLSDYLHEEVRLLPTAVELEHFYDQVDELRLRVDRLQARAALLDRTDS